MLEVMDSEYVKLARIKGLPEWKVVWKHCLRNAALAPLTYFGLIVGGFVTGSVVIETVFSWPWGRSADDRRSPGPGFSGGADRCNLHCLHLYPVQLAGRYTLRLSGPPHPIQLTL
jgi:Binding-protein-dependent transport system inner membrane component